MKHIFTLSLCFLALSLSAYGQVPDYVPTEGLVAWYPMESSLANAFGDEHNGEFFSIDSVDGANAESLGASIFNGTVLIQADLLVYQAAYATPVVSATMGTTGTGGLLQSPVPAHGCGDWTTATMSTETTTLETTASQLVASGIKNFKL